MEYLDFGTWFHYFLLIISGFLVLLIVLLLYSNRYTRKKINEIEQNVESVESYTELLSTKETHSIKKGL